MVRFQNVHSETLVWSATSSCVAKKSPQKKPANTLLGNFHKQRAFARLKPLGAQKSQEVPFDRVKKPPEGGVWFTVRLHSLAVYPARLRHRHDAMPMNALS